MKAKVIVLICTVFITFFCCQKEDSHIYKSDGIITGPDIRMCACCGGYYIQIESVIYEFNSLPDNSNIDLQTESFPLFVKLDWQLANLTGCPDTKIIIQRIKKE
jgi:hypothetical protein